MFQGAGALVLWECLKTEVSGLGLYLYWQWRWVGKSQAGPLHSSVHSPPKSCCSDILTSSVYNAAYFTDPGIQQETGAYLLLHTTLERSKFINLFLKYWTLFFIVPSKICVNLTGTTAHRQLPLKFNLKFEIPLKSIQD